MFHVKQSCVPVHFVVVAQGCCLCCCDPFLAWICSVAFLPFAPLGNAVVVNLFCSFWIAIAVSISLANLHLCAPVLATRLACVVHKLFLGGAEPFCFFAFSSAMHIVVSRETFGCALFPHFDAKFGTFCCGGDLPLGLVLFAFYTSLFCLPAWMRFFVRILF